MCSIFRLLGALMLAVSSGFFFSACSSTRDLGRVSLLSETAVATGTDYELKAVGRTGTGTNLQEAISAAVRQTSGGLFLKNAEVRMVRKKKLQVTGDIWGKVDSNKIDAQAGSLRATPIKPVIVVGDRVRFSSGRGRQRTGRVVGFKKNLAIVEVAGPRRFQLYLAIPIQALTKY